MFKFGFSEINCEKGEENEGDEKTTQLTWFPASEICVTPKHIQEEYSIEDYAKNCVFDVDIKLISADKVSLNLRNKDHENIIKAEENHSDLLPSVYEGGLKIWECSYELGKFLIKTEVQLDGKRVLDLGCGAGIIGLLALLKGSNVHFQDYNAEVIQLMTIPNVLLNLGDRQLVHDKCKFYSGDWASFTKLCSSKYTKEEDKYDIILTCETIYNPINQKKLYEVFKQMLKKSGVGYLAAKTYYFGVGGGMRQFESLVKDDQVFDTEIVWKSTIGTTKGIVYWHCTNESWSNFFKFD